MALNPKQRRFLEATETQRGYTGVGGGSVPMPSMATPRAASLPITTPGGAVSSGGYLEGTQFKRNSMLPMRKIR